MALGLARPNELRSPGHTMLPGSDLSASRVGGGGFWSHTDGKPPRPGFAPHRPYLTCPDTRGARGLSVGLVTAPTKRSTLPQDFKRGDRVEWNFRGRTVRGTVRRRLTRRTEIAGRVVAASRDDPRYVVRSEKSGKETIRRAEALRRADGRPSAGAEPAS